MIASNCEQLEIFIDDGHVTTGLPALGNPLYSNLAHPPFFVTIPGVSAPSVLHIRGYVGGQQVTELLMSSDTSQDHLGMHADDSVILADGSDMTRVVFRAQDIYGNQRRYTEDEVTLNLDGPGVLIGDNPFAFGEYGGLGAVWVRSISRQPGTITLTAVHPDLGKARVQIRSQWVDAGDVPV
jgi:beta-galactosidase